MSGNLLNLMRSTARSFTNSGGFEEDMVISTRDGSNTSNIKGSVSKHWVAFDEEGERVNSLNAHICIVEDDLLDLGYPVRNENNDVMLYSHIVDVNYSNGVVKKYTVSECFPNETYGLIVLILSPYSV